MYRDCLEHLRYLYLLRHQDAQATNALPEYLAHKIHHDLLQLPKGSQDEISRQKGLSTYWQVEEVRN